MAHLAVQNPGGEIQSGRSNHGRRVHEHPVLDHCQLYQVLRQVEQLVFRLRYLTEALQEAIAAEERQIEFEGDQD